MGRQAKNELLSILPTQEAIGEHLSQLRKDKGLTQKELAEKIGITRSAIADYENGKNRIYDVMLIRIANILNVTPNDLLLFENKNQKTKITSLRFIKRMLKIKSFPEHQQKYILKSLDSLIKNVEDKLKE